MKIFKQNNKLKTSTFRIWQNQILNQDIIGKYSYEKVLNIGASPEDTDKQGKLYSEYFTNKDYYTLDVNVKHQSPKHFVVDLHDMGAIQIKFDLILIMSVLEHVKNPFVVASQLKTKLKSTGYIYVTVPFFYQIHKDLSVGFSDYWRFTDDGIREVFKDYKEVWIKPMTSIINEKECKKRSWGSKNTPTGFCALFKNK